MDIKSGVVSTKIPGHDYGATAADVDALIIKYLPNASDELRAIVTAGVLGALGGIDYCDILTVIELLLILGQYDGVTAV